MDETPNLKLPYIMAAQAQKHVTHNEAIRALDAIVQIGVADRDLSAPPVSPADGARYIVAGGATGDWSGHAGEVAAWQDGAWMFYGPLEGWLAWVADENALVVWDGAAWVAATDRVPLLGINATADATNRLALASAASLFNHAGAGHQHKINKNAAGDTASILFQTGFAGRAEFGLTGDDHWHVKVSANGSSWIDALTVKNDTGNVVFGHSSSLPGVAGLDFGIQNHGTTNAKATLSQARWGNVAFGCSSWLMLSRNSTIGSHTIVQSGDAVGQLGFAGSDGANFIQLAGVRGEVDGTPGTNDMPGRLVFQTTPDGSATPTERLRISNNGVLTSQASYSNTVTGSALEVTSAGVIGRTSSSIRGKTDLEAMDVAIALDAVKSVRAKFFRRSEHGGDLEANWSQYGFIAEELAAVDPRFARYALYREEFEPVELEPGRIENVRRVEKREEPVVQDLDRDAILAAAWTVLAELVRRIEALEEKA
jgi:hypothetical protein